jgi:hypothetical protein
VVRPFAPMAPTLRGSLEAPEITPDKANRPLNPISNRFSNRRVLKAWRMSFSVKTRSAKTWGPVDGAIRNPQNRQARSGALCGCRKRP